MQYCDEKHCNCGMCTWLGSRQHSSKRRSSGSLGLRVRRVSSRKSVARTSKFSAVRMKTGKHCERTKPQIRIITSNSRILFNATISLLISYWRNEERIVLSVVVTRNAFASNLRQSFYSFQSFHDYRAISLEYSMQGRLPIGWVAANSAASMIPRWILWLRGPTILCRCRPERIQTKPLKWTHNLIFITKRSHGSVGIRATLSKFPVFSNDWSILYGQLWQGGIQQNSRWSSNYGSMRATLTRQVFSRSFVVAG